MAEKLLMLALSPTMESGIIAQWHVHEGDRVSAGDVVCGVETDKATMDYESPASGVMLKIVLPEGSSAAIGDLIAIVGKEGEDISALLGDSPQVPGSPAASADVPGQSSGKSPETKADHNSVQAVGSAEAASSVLQPSAGTGPVRSSPLARKLAATYGLSLERLSGSGPEGRIVKADVERAREAAARESGPVSTAPGQMSAGTPVQPVSAPAAAGQDLLIPVSGKRRIIARRLSESMFTAPHYYLKVTADMDAILSVRSRLASQNQKVSINAFLIKLAAEALKKHPHINASWQGDNILQYGRIDIGLAVAQDDGLITPVVRDCGSKGILQIDQELSGLIDRARSNSLKPEEYTGATFTISSLGSYGIDEFTAIINPPGSAILAVGSIRKEPVVGQDDQIVIRTQVHLTLSCDHRVIDGAVGAAFLTDLHRLLEEPVRALL